MMQFSFEGNVVRKSLIKYLFSLTWILKIVIPSKYECTLHSLLVLFACFTLNKQEIEFFKMLFELYYSLLAIQSKSCSNLGKLGSVTNNQDLVGIQEAMRPCTGILPDIYTRQAVCSPAYPWKTSFLTVITSGHKCIIRTIME